MKLDIISIEDKGDLSKETIWLKANSDATLHDYLVCDTTYTDDHHISNELRHVFWFPNQKVQKGDFVALHTKDGTKSSNTNDQKTTTYHYYWNLGRTVWNKDGDCAVLFEV